MSTPTLRSVGAQVNGTGAVTVPMPSHAVNTVLLMHVETSNETVTLTSAASFSAVSSSGSGTGTSATSNAVRLSAYWLRATSSGMSAPVIGDAGDHVLAIITAYDGCILTGIPWNITSGNLVSSSSSYVQVRGGTSTVSECLIVAASASAREVSPGQYASWLNPDLSNVSEIVDIATTDGNGGTIGIAIGSKATAGSFQTTTAALFGSNNARQANLMIALRPPLPLPPGSGTSQSPIHTYASAGTYVVTLTVTDNDGLTSTYTSTVTVS